ncbi:MAG: hypothetical protein Q4D76_09820 [Oscillospiraceae bacterium]|nr:hypothetical protein [Oscillospiraceae bacterium]
MDREKFLKDFRKFLEDNYEQVMENTIRLEDLPEDDDWRQDEVWDGLYVRKAVNNE